MRTLRKHGDKDSMRALPQSSPLEAPRKGAPASITSGSPLFVVAGVRIETPATKLGSTRAMIPERLIGLPPGELLTLAVLLSMRRTRACLSVSFSELVRSIGFCGRTLAKHVASLREKGLVHPDALKVLPAAYVQPGERFAKIRTDRVSITKSAAYRLHVLAQLYTDKQGRLRVSRRYLARKLGCSTRHVRRLIAQLLGAGYAFAARVFSVATKSVRSARKKASALSVNRSIKRVFNRSKVPKVKPKATRPPSMTRQEQLAWLRKQGATP